MRSLSAGFDEMSYLVNEFYLSVFGVSEITWLDVNSPFNHYRYLDTAWGWPQFTGSTACPDGGSVAVYVR